MPARTPTREGAAPRTVKEEEELEVLAEIMPTAVTLEIKLQGERVSLPVFELAEDPRSKLFTTENQVLILRGLLDGLALVKAAALVGAGRVTVEDWRRKGEENPDGPYGAFERARSQVEAVFQAKTLMEVPAANDKNGCWTAYMTLLERRFPTEFGRSDKRYVEHGLQQGLAAQVIESQKRRALAGHNRATGD